MLTAKVCKFCHSSQEKRNERNMITRVCKSKNIDVSGFESCGEFGKVEDKQCTLCIHESGDNPICSLCMQLDERYYFESKVVSEDES